MKGDNCTSACVTRDHDSWGECMRAKNTRIGYCGQGGGDATLQKRMDSDIAFYREARKQGLQPSGSTRGAVERAFEISDVTGKPWRADKPELSL